MLALASTFALGAKAEPWTLTGKVIYVADGDTIMLIDLAPVVPDTIQSLR